MKSEFRADTAKLLELAAENERLRADLAEARAGLPTRWVSQLQEEIATLRAKASLREV